MTEKDTKRYVLSVVGAVEAATIEARLERTEASLESPASVLRRAADLPDPDWYLKGLRCFDSNWTPISPEPFQPYKRAARIKARIKAKEEAAARKSLSRGGKSWRDADSSESPIGKFLGEGSSSPEDGEGSRPPPGRPSTSRPSSGGRKSQMEKEPAEMLEIAEEDFGQREMPIVYRVFQPTEDQLEVLNKKVNFLAILEREAIEAELAKEQKKEEAKLAREKEQKELLKRLNKQAKRGSSDVLEQVQKKEGDPEDSDEEVLKELENRPKVTKRYQLAVEQDPGMQLLPRIGQQIKDVAWEGPFTLDVEIICKDKDATIDSSSGEESTKADNTPSRSSSDGGLPAWLDGSVELTRIAVQFDIAAEFGPILQQYLAELQNYFVQKLGETYKILGDEMSLRPEIDLEKSGSLYQLGFRLNIPKGHPDCPEEEQIQDTIEKALMEILFKITGRDQQNCILGRRGSAVTTDDRYQKGGKKSEDTGPAKRTERKKYVAKKKVREQQKEVRALSAQEMEDFVNKLLDEMNYRIKILQEHRAQHAAETGYTARPCDDDRTENIFVQWNGADGRERPTLKPVVYVPGITKKRADITGTHVDVRKVYSKDDLMAQKNEDDDNSSSNSKTGGEPGKIPLGRMGNNVKTVAGKEKSSKLNAEFHPMDPATMYAKAEDLTPRTIKRLDVDNPDSYAAYSKRIRFLNSITYLNASRDHGYEKFDFVWFTREWQTMYMRFQEQKNKALKRQIALNRHITKKRNFRKDTGGREVAYLDDDLTNVLSGKLDGTTDEKDSNTGSGGGNSELNNNNSTIGKGKMDKLDEDVNASIMDSTQFNDTSTTGGKSRNQKNIPPLKMLLEWGIFPPQEMDKITTKVITKPEHLDQELIKLKKKEERERLKKEAEEARLRAAADLDQILLANEEFAQNKSSTSNRSGRSAQDSPNKSSTSQLNPNKSGDGKYNRSRKANNRSQFADASSAHKSSSSQSLGPSRRGSQSPGTNSNNKRGSTTSPGTRGSTAGMSGTSSTALEKRAAKQEKIKERNKERNNKERNNTLNSSMGTKSNSMSTGHTGIHRSGSELGGIHVRGRKPRNKALLQQKDKKPKVCSIPKPDMDAIPDRGYAQSEMWSNYSVFRDAIKKKYNYWAEDSAGQPVDIFNDAFDTWERLMNQGQTFEDDD